MLSLLTATSASTLLSQPSSTSIKYAHAFLPPSPQASQLLSQLHDENNRLDPLGDFSVRCVDVTYKTDNWQCYTILYCTMYYSIGSTTGSADIVHAPKHVEVVGA